MPSVSRFTLCLLLLAGNACYASATQCVTIDNQAQDAKQSTCEQQNMRLLSEKPSIRSKILGNEPLPPQLEYRLRRLMSKISDYRNSLKTDHQKTPSTPVTRARQFGAVIDDNESRRINALQILAVSPFSPAAKLGLVSGDLILALGNMTIELSDKTSVSHILDNYFNPLTVGQEVKITVVRNDEKIILSDTFNPVTVPEVYYQLGQSNNVQTEQ